MPGEPTVVFILSSVSWIDNDYVDVFKSSLFLFIFQDTGMNEIFYPSVILVLPIENKEEWNINKEKVCWLLDDTSPQFFFFFKPSYSIPTRLQFTAAVSVFMRLTLIQTRNLICTVDLHSVFHFQSVIPTVMPYEIPLLLITTASDCMREFMLVTSPALVYI